MVKEKRQWVLGTCWGRAHECWAHAGDVPMRNRPRGLWLLGTVARVTWTQSPVHTHGAVNQKKSISLWDNVLNLKK